MNQRTPYSKGTKVDIKGFFFPGTVVVDRGADSVWVLTGAGQTLALHYSEVSYND